MDIFKEKGFPAKFVGQSTTKLVQGRTKWKVKNRYCPTVEEPQYCTWEDEMEYRKMTELEEIYNEFCEKAYSYLRCHITNNGENTPHRIIFPDFYYEIIPSKFKIE